MTLKIRLVLLAILSAMSTTDAADPIDIGSRRELFVDSLLVGRLNGVRHRLHHPRPAEIAVTLDKPW